MFGLNLTFIGFVILGVSLALFIGFSVIGVILKRKYKTSKVVTAGSHITAFTTFLTAVILLAIFALWVLPILFIGILIWGGISLARDEDFKLPTFGNLFRG